MVTIRRLIAAATIVLLAASPALSQSTGTVTGQVLEISTERPLVGAQVSIAGTGLGTLTNEAGRYLLANVPAGPVTVRIQMIGYETQEQSATLAEGETVTLDFQLEQQAIALDEVVVTGRVTGTSRRNLANAVATVNADELTNVPAQTIEGALQAKVPGINIFSNNGAPGGGMKVELRGITSIIGSSQPLYVVDGVIVSNASVPSGQSMLVNAADAEGAEDNAPNRIADLNPNDVESITVLKGASAAAMYGSKASNGVILIETRDGAYGAGTSFSIRQRMGFSSVSNTLGLRRFETESAVVDAFGEEALPYWKPGEFFDHEAELSDRNPINYETSVSMRGGTGNTRYYVSGLNRHDGGVVLNTGYDKRSLRVNIGHRFGSFAELSVNTSAVRAETRRGITNNDNRSISYWMAMPTTPSFLNIRQNPDGSYPLNPFGSSNVLETANEVEKEEEVNRFIGSAELTLTPLSTGTHELRLMALAGIDYFSLKNGSYAPPGLEFELAYPPAGTSTLGKTDSEQMNAGVNLVHAFTPSVGLSATTALGFQYERRYYDFAMTTAEGLVPGVRNVDTGTNVGLRQDREQVEDFGVYVSENVLIGDRLYLSAALRADQSSTNADPQEIFYYPRAAASYRFVDLPGFLDEIKLRAAYGQSGNRPLYGQKFALLNAEVLSGLRTLELDGSVAALDLRPERQTEFEGGIDIQMFDGRASLQLTGYQNNITDMLLRRTLAGSTGFNVLFLNGGEMRNRGIEVALQAVPIQSEGWSWTSNTSFYLNRALVIDLPVPAFSPPLDFGGLGGYRIEEGFSPTAIIGSKLVGDSIVTDVRLGESRPDFTMGFGNEVRYRNFSLFGLVDWKHGGLITNLTKWLFDTAKTSADYAADCTVSLCEEGETLGEMRFRLYPELTGIYLEDAGFVKLRELRLSWDAPLDLVQSFGGGVQSLRFSLSGRNLLTFTDYTGMDPEVSNFGNQTVSRNQDVAPYPPSRSFWFSVDVGF